MQLVIEYNFRLKYIYLYLTRNAQASFQTQGTGEKNFHKKGTGDTVHGPRHRRHGSRKVLHGTRLVDFA